MHNEKMEAALRLASRYGFRVFPLRENGTTPIWEGWPETATADEATIRAWWSGANWNIGICSTGLLIVDVDTKKGRAGLASWAALGAPDTLTVRTKSGGFHHYYWGADVALSQGALGEGLDIRSHNGYVVAPGSTVDGARYEVVRDVPMLRAPQHIVAMCKPPGQRAESAAVALVELDTFAAVQAAVDRVARAEIARAGEQSDRAYKLAAAVRDHGISEALCFTIMQPWGLRCEPPVIGDDLRGRIANAYAYAQNAPGAKHPEVLFGKPDIPPVPPSPSREEAHAEQAARSRLRVMSMDDCEDLPPLGYVIKNMVAPGQVGSIYGQPGAGKSVIAPYLAHAVAKGRPAFGQRTTQGKVFYVSAEDERGMQKRVKALGRRFGRTPDLQLIDRVSALVTANDEVSPDMARLLQLAEERRPSLIVVDTLAASISGLDENAAKDMNKIVAAMRSLAQFGAAVIVVHHSPKSGDTPRGYGSLNGDFDFTILVGPDPTAEGVKRGEMKKNRNGSCDLEILFEIGTETLGEDQDGDPITAPVCLERTAKEVRAGRQEKLTKAEAGAVAELQRLAVESLPANAASGSRLPPVPLGIWEAACLVRGVCSDAARPQDRAKQFRAALNGLEGKFRVHWNRENQTVQYSGPALEDRRPAPPTWPVGVVMLPPPPPPVAPPTLN